MQRPAARTTPFLPREMHQTMHPASCVPALDQYEPSSCRAYFIPVILVRQDVRLPLSALRLVSLFFFFFFARMHSLPQVLAGLGFVGFVAFDAPLTEH